MRAIVLGWLDDAQAAALRTSDAADADALHDFRVALRRLRSTLRAYRPYLAGQVGRGLRRRLRRISIRTNEGRDAEVQLAWLDPQIATLPQPRRLAARRLARQLNQVGRRHRATMGNVRQRFESLESRLRRRATGIPSGAPVPFAAVLAERVAREADRLLRQLARITGQRGMQRMHAARIAGKRLRYVIEPLVPSLAAAQAAVDRLKALQDLLGDLRDVRIIERDLDAALTRMRVSPSRSGLLLLRRRARARARELYTALDADWLQGRAAAFGTELEGLARSLFSREDLPVEVERKFLLRGLPDRVGLDQASEVEQGYLPGSTLHERVRSVRSGSEVHYYRTIKFGRGLKRTEIEEETTAEVFQVLWGLTEGKRVRKRRYRVPDGGLTWEIDQFTDRELFLAEVELPDESTAVSMPDWLAPLVDREVTDDLAYTNLQLAR